MSIEEASTESLIQELKGRIDLETIKILEQLILPRFEATVFVGMMKKDDNRMSFTSRTIGQVGNLFLIARWLDHSLIKDLEKHKTREDD